MLKKWLATLEPPYAGAPIDVFDVAAIWFQTVAEAKHHWSNRQ